MLSWAPGDSDSGTVLAPGPNPRIIPLSYLEVHEIHQFCDLRLEDLHGFLVNFHSVRLLITLHLGINRYDNSKASPAGNEGGKAGAASAGGSLTSQVEFKGGWAVQVGGTAWLSWVELIKGVACGAGARGGVAWLVWQSSGVPVGWPGSSSSRYTA